MATKSRSSLANHVFPSFYACYLLKSIKTSGSKATYVGSTPNPPKRLRQHNREIAGGAAKTLTNRPWTMTMIVHGFPSKLAALQFEWAWQKPHLSRHLKDQAGQRLFPHSVNLLKARILVVRTMLATPPWNTWPLHVKIFNPEASKAWQRAEIGAPSLPQGFTCVQEYEGVDGKTLYATATRSGPIDIKDEEFTARQLEKLEKLTGPHECWICHSAVDTSDHLKYALCPSSSCQAVSHLTCLAHHFAPKAIVPRGGNCDTCQSYILWGDVIRGCYRRKARRAVVLEDDEAPEYESLNSDSEIVCTPQKRMSKGGEVSPRDALTRWMENLSMDDDTAPTPLRNKLPASPRKPKRAPRTAKSPTRSRSRSHSLEVIDISDI